MTEKRKEKRTEVTTGNVTVQNDVNGDELGTLINISPGGLCIRGEKDFYEGETFEMMIELDKPIFGISRILVDAECVWCNPEEGNTYFRSGFKFTYVTAGNANIILGFIMDQ